MLSSIASMACGKLPLNPFSTFSYSSFVDGICKNIICKYKLFFWFSLLTTDEKDQRVEIGSVICIRRGKSKFGNWVFGFIAGITENITTENTIKICS